MVCSGNGSMLDLYINDVFLRGICCLFFVDKIGDLCYFKELELLIIYFIGKLNV